MGHSLWSSTPAWTASSATGKYFPNLHYNPNTRRTDPYILLEGYHQDGVWGGVTHTGDVIGYHEYDTRTERYQADAYFSDFLAYTLEKTSSALIMSRPCDNGGMGQIPVYLCSSPRDVEAFGWVGDNDGDWAGLGLLRLAGLRQLRQPLLQPQSTWGMTDFSWTLGTDIFVHPITEDNTATVNVTVPVTEDGDSWVFWWETSIVAESGETIEVPCPLDQIPAFKRAGALLPLRKPDGRLVFSAVQPASTEKAHVLEHNVVGGVEASYTAGSTGSSVESLTVSAATERVAFEFAGVECPRTMQFAAAAGVSHKCEGSVLLIEVEDATMGARVEFA